ACAPQAMGQNAEVKEGAAASSAAAESSVAASHPLESICKLYCSRCCVWSACSSIPSIADACSSCGSAATISYGYFLQLLLHDSTGELPVLLCGREAEELFHGLPADNLYSSRTTC